MNLRQLDLNLLVILDVLLAEQNVTRAAERLGLSQSAVSHALRRLRAQFDDELLARGGSGMELTWRARQLRDGLRSALSQLETLAGKERDFQPERSTRSFRLRVTDYVSDRLLTQVCTVLRREAPGVRLHVEHFSDAAQHLLADEIHVRMASDIGQAAQLRQVSVIDEAFAVLMSKAHPSAGARMTLDLYVQLSHLKVSASAVGSNMIDDALRRRGLSRRVVVQLPSWVDVGPIVQATDLVAAIPHHWASDPVFRRFCRARKLPLEEVKFAISVIWDRRFDDDPGHAWMRSVIIDVMRAQGGKGSKPSTPRAG